MKTFEDLCLSVSCKKYFFNILKCYNSNWLKLSLSTVSIEYGTTICINIIRFTKLKKKINSVLFNFIEDTVGLIFLLNASC